MTSSIRIAIRIAKISFYCAILRYLNYLKGDKSSFFWSKKDLSDGKSQILNSQGYGKNHKSIRKDKTPQEAIVNAYHPIFLYDRGCGQSIFTLFNCFCPLKKCTCV